MRAGGLVILALSVSAVVLAEEGIDFENTAAGNEVEEEEEEDMDDPNLHCERPIEEKPIVNLTGWSAEDSESEEEAAEEEEEDDGRISRSSMRRLYEYMNADGDKLHEEEVWNVINNLKPGTVPWVQRLGELDTDKDKRVSMSELMAEEKYKINTQFGRKMFRAADENNDGALDMEEWLMLNNPWKSPKLVTVIAEDMMHRLNKDGEEGLTFSEWSQEVEGVYEPHELEDKWKKLDTDYDDLLDQEELENWENRRWFFRMVVMRMFEYDYHNDGLTLEEFEDGRDMYLKTEVGTFLEGLLDEIDPEDGAKTQGPERPSKDEL